MKMKKTMLVLILSILIARGENRKINNNIKIEYAMNKTFQNLSINLLNKHYFKGSKKLFTSIELGINNKMKSYAEIGYLMKYEYNNHTLGGYIYLINQQSYNNNNNIYQITMGTDFKTKDIHININFYFPINQHNLIKKELPRLHFSNNLLAIYDENLYELFLGGYSVDVLFYLNGPVQIGLNITKYNINNIYIKMLSLLLGCDINNYVNATAKFTLDNNKIYKQLSISCSLLFEKQKYCRPLKNTYVKTYVGKKYK